MVHEAASAGFQRSADAYDRARPDYPEASVAWLWDALGLAAGDRVVDVGAGTGKLSAPLAARGADVVAVEPVAAMRERLVAAVPSATAVDAAAEALPVADGSAAAVVAGQAFHWFANDAALAEFHRVLRPEAHLGLIWNRRRLDDPLQAAISELLEPVRGDTPRYASAPGGRRWRTASCSRRPPSTSWISSRSSTAPGLSTGSARRASSRLSTPGRGRSCSAGWRRWWARGRRRGFRMCASCSRIGGTSPAPASTGLTPYGSYGPKRRQTTSSTTPTGSSSRSSIARTDRLAAR